MVLSAAATSRPDAARGARFVEGTNPYWRFDWRRPPGAASTRRFLCLLPLFMPRNTRTSTPKNH